MEMSVREARAQFAAALAAAGRGERVTITKNGKAVAELGPPAAAPVESVWERTMRVRREMGLDRLDPVEGFDEDWRKEFDDPALSREVLGLGPDWNPNRG